MKIQHFLLTRFNVHLESFDEQYTRKWPGIDDDYLRKRFSLFEEYCLPSVAVQKSPFKWLIFLSAQTPEKYRQRVLAWADRCNFLQPIYIDDLIPLKNEGRSVYVQVINKLVDADTDYVVTSRIDNDDAMGYDLLANCRIAAQNAIIKDHYRYFFISPVNGFAYNKDYNLLQSYYYKTNHFLSLVCEKKEIDTIFSYSHVEIYNMGKPVVEVEAPSQWLEVVHANNLDNSTGLYQPFVHLDKEWMKDKFNVTVGEPINAEPLILALSRELQSLYTKLSRIKRLWPFSFSLAILRFFKKH